MTFWCKGRHSNRALQPGQSRDNLGCHDVGCIQFRGRPDTLQCTGQRLPRGVTPFQTGVLPRPGSVRGGGQDRPQLCPGWASLNVVILTISVAGLAGGFLEGQHWCLFSPLTGPGRAAAADMCRLVSVHVCACVRVSVCVRSHGGRSLFGLVRLSVYVCVHWRGSVQKKLPVISFPCLPESHGQLADTRWTSSPGEIKKSLRDDPSLPPSASFDYPPCSHLGNETGGQ